MGLAEKKGLITYAHVVLFTEREEIGGGGGANLH